LIGLLMAAGLVLIGCEGGVPNCKGNGECTVTVGQGTSGLYVDSNAPRSSCGTSATYKTDSNGKGYYSGGCKVQNVIDNIDGKRSYGTHGCDCRS